MKVTIPDKLKPGDLVRLIAPSHSYAIVNKEQREIAKKRFENELGLKISFGKYVEEQDEFDSSSVKHRLFDLHEAFADNNVRIVPY
jgi:muramoyltetrapeptide carboxypeptidase LdcA involved in peptidoglycan recycling